MSSLQVWRQNLQEVAKIHAPEYYITDLKTTSEELVVASDTARQL